MRRLPPIFPPRRPSSAITREISGDGFGADEIASSPAASKSEGAPMKVLVIGGTLFIGKLLVEELLKEGHDIAVLHRKPKHDFARRVEYLMADRNDAESLREVLSGRRFDVVFDNVYDFERGTTAAQVEATVRACGDRISRYIFMSSVAAYGDGLNHKESDPLAPDYHADPYVRHKATTERLLFRMHSQTGLPLVTFRPP